MDNSNTFKKLEPGMSTVRLLPNIHDFRTIVFGLDVCSQRVGKKPVKVTKYFCQALVGGEPCCLLLPTRLYHIIRAAMAGRLVVNNEWEVVSNNADDGPYHRHTTHDGFDQIVPGESENHQTYKDAKLLPHTNPFDMKSNFLLVVETFMRNFPESETKLADYRVFVDMQSNSAVWDGTESDQVRIGSILKNLPSPEACAEYYMQQLKNNNPDFMFMFGADAKEYYGKHRNRVLTRPGTIEMLNTSFGIELGESNEKTQLLMLSFPDGVSDIDTVATRAVIFFDGEVVHKEPKLIHIMADRKMVCYALMFAFKQNYDKLSMDK